ncbi:tyrosine-type recombinase/integrase [Anaerobacillus isosaccharinicus]|uniref:Tyrosine-type recombinase/integrase n=1 Tax=Anaerobacillus isosaccharinicus TaxID=1532552 RepID=A0A7S7L9S1_9BACI|nr:tyrosine-type recombinase/integrase [Anaerobacillus isosaccharinicus]
MVKKPTVESSVKMVLEALEKAGYCQSTIHSFKRVYERLLKSAAIMGTETLIQELVEHFVNDSAHRRTGQYCHSRKKLHTSCIRKLREYEERGYFGWQPSRDSKVDKPSTIKFQDLHIHFLAFLQEEKKSKNTIESYRNTSCKFLIFIEKLGYTELKAVPLKSIYKFFDELRETWDSGSLRTAASGLRSFLRFAEGGNRLIAAVPDKLLRKRTIIPVLTEEEERAVWDVLQTDAVSSRDKAIILLSLLTGIRAVDILNLRLKDIDWQGDVINIVQQKTNEPLVLPLLPAIGNALVRYLTNDRPKSDSSCVFLSRNAPHVPLKEHSSCYTIVRKIFTCAGVRVNNELKGTRLLRHHVASKMLKNGVAIQTISSTLGHVNPNSADVYLSTDEEKMRDCALTLAVIPMKVKGLK